MNPDAPQNLRAELEARLTSLLLGELSGDDAELLRKLIAHDPELTKLHEQLKLTVELVRETATSTAETSQAAPALKLSAERREKLLAKFKTVQPKEFAPPAKRFSLARVAVAVAAVFVLIGAIAILCSPSSRQQNRIEISRVFRRLPRYAPVISAAARRKRSLARRRSADLERLRGEGTITVSPAKGLGETQLKEQSTTAETLKISLAAPPVVTQPDNDRSAVRHRDRFHNSAPRTER